MDDVIVNAVQVDVATGGLTEVITGQAGPPGSGPSGASAYQIAVANGFVGSETQWLASLVQASNADAVAFDDAMTGLGATTVQAAIVALYQLIGATSTGASPFDFSNPAGTGGAFFMGLL